jgi:type IV pilus assembly protein PilX
MKNRALTRHAGSAPAARQRGVALIVGLVLLVLLALLGASAYSVATQEERMAGNARDHARAFEAAEYALRECEKIVINSAPVFTSNGSASTGMYLPPPNGQLVGDTGTPGNWASQLVLTAPSGTAKAPVCIADEIKQPPLSPGKTSFLPGTARVTAVGYGGNSNTQVILVSYVNFLPAP